MSSHPALSPISASMLADQETFLALEGRRRYVRNNHQASDRWYHMYETVELGTIPTPEECADAPPSQRLLAKIPNIKLMRKASTLRHFFSSISRDECQC